MSVFNRKDAKNLIVKGSKRQSDAREYINSVMP